MPETVYSNAPYNGLSILSMAPQCWRGKLDNEYTITHKSLLCCMPEATTALEPVSRLFEACIRLYILGYENTYERLWYGTYLSLEHDGLCSLPCLYVVLLVSFRPITERGELEINQSGSCWGRLRAGGYPCRRVLGR